MKKHIIYLSCCVALSGCLQENKAPVAYKEGVFYGRDGVYDRGGNELPKYNNYNRADLPPEQDAKYVNDNQHSYGVSAEVGGVSSADLPPPTSQPTTSAPVMTQEPTAPLTPDDSPFVPEGVVPKTQPQTRIEWQRQQDNAVSEYSKKELELQEEAEQVQRAAKQELEQPSATTEATAQTVDTASLVPAGITDAAQEKKAQAEKAYDEALAEREAAAAIAAQTEIAPEPAKKEAFLWPLKGKIVKDFATDSGKGVVIAGRVGEPVRSSASGVVVHVGNKLKSYGNMIIIQHPDGYVTTYAHLSETVVSMDDNVVGGQLIGFVGKTGDAPQPQLHFALRHNTEPLDPQKMLK